MIDPTPDRRAFGRRLLLHWRGCCVAVVLVALVGFMAGYGLLAHIPTKGALALTGRTLIIRLMIVAGTVCSGFMLWIILASGETLWLRAQARRRHQPLRGRFFAIRLPKPIATTDPHGAAAARGGYVEAVNATDPFRTLATALETHAGDARIALELWGGADGRVQWGVWLPPDQALILTVQSLLSGAAPGIDIRPVDDPLEQITHGE